MRVTYSLLACLLTAKQKKVLQSGFIKDTTEWGKLALNRGRERERHFISPHTNLKKTFLIKCIKKNHKLLAVQRSKYQKTFKIIKSKFFLIKVTVKYYYRQLKNKNKNKTKKRTTKAYNNYENNKIITQRETKKCYKVFGLL